MMSLTHRIALSRDHFACKLIFLVNKNRLQTFPFSRQENRNKTNCNLCQCLSASAVKVLGNNNSEPQKRNMAFQKGAGPKGVKYKRNNLDCVCLAHLTILLVHAYMCVCVCFTSSKGIYCCSYALL